MAGDDGAAFTVAVSNSAGSVTSSGATLSVAAPAPAATAPSITTQPASLSVGVGQTATFTVTAAGTAPLTYQWSKSGTAISGATAASYTTSATVSGDNNSTFSVTITNSAGSLTSSNATLTVTASSAPSGGVDVATYKNDNSRSGLNAAETTLTTANVIASKFGKLRTLAVDGKVDAQPLVLSQLAVGGAPHNVVFVATEHDSVYAFDADTGTPLWQVSLLASGETPSDTRGCSQITPEIGITATPVIDRAAGAHGTLYVVAMSRDGSGNYHQRLHALDLTTGASVAGPTPIGAMVTMQGGGSNTFDPGAYEVRSALTLVNGSLIIAFTSHCDMPPYSGWVLAYSPSSLSLTGTLNLGPNSQAGPAIWMAGGGPAADSSGNVYLLTANGAFETTLTASGFPSKGDYGNAFVKISTAGGTLSVTDYFAVTDTLAASRADRDLGSGSAMLLPDLKDAGGAPCQLVVGAGKDGRMYVVDRNNMGKFSPSGNHIYATVPMAAAVFSSPAWFNHSVYYGPINSPVQQYSSPTDLHLWRRDHHELRLPRQRHRHLGQRYRAGHRLGTRERAGRRPARVPGKRPGGDLQQQPGGGRARPLRYGQQVHHADRCQRQGVRRHHQQRRGVRSAELTALAFRRPGAASPRFPRRSSARAAQDRE